MQRCAGAGTLLAPVASVDGGKKRYKFSIFFFFDRQYEGCCLSKYTSVESTLCTWASRKLSSPLISLRLRGEKKKSKLHCINFFFFVSSIFTMLAFCLSSLSLYLGSNAVKGRCLRAREHWRDFYFFPPFISSLPWTQLPLSFIVVSIVAMPLSLFFFAWQMSVAAIVRRAIFIVLFN